MSEKRNKVAEKKVDVEAKTVTWEFSNGETVIITLGEIPADILTRAALHGISQKGGDAYSSEKDPTEAAAKCREVLERLRTGDWAAQRERGVGSISLTVQAIADLRGVPVEAIQAKWATLDEETQKALRKDERVQAKMAEIKAARLAAKAERAEESDALGVAFPA